MMSKETGKHARLYADDSVVDIDCGELQRGARISDVNGCHPVTDFTASDSYQT